MSYVVVAFTFRAAANDVAFLEMGGKDVPDILFWEEMNDVVFSTNPTENVNYLVLPACTGSLEVAVDVGPHFLKHNTPHVLRVKVWFTEEERALMSDCKLIIDVDVSRYTSYENLHADYTFVVELPVLKVSCKKLLDPGWVLCKRGQGRDKVAVAYSEALSDIVHSDLVS